MCWLGGLDGHGVVAATWRNTLGVMRLRVHGDAKNAEILVLRHQPTGY
jgi:hypothetical protein